MRLRFSCFSDKVHKTGMNAQVELRENASKGSAAAKFINVGVGVGVGELSSIYSSKYLQPTSERKAEGRPCHKH